MDATHGRRSLSAPAAPHHDLCANQHVTSNRLALPNRWMDGTHANLGGVEPPRRCRVGRRACPRPDRTACANPSRDSRVHSARGGCPGSSRHVTLLPRAWLGSGRTWSPVVDTHTWAPARAFRALPAAGSVRENGTWICHATRGARWC